MAENLIKLGGYVVQGVDNPETLDLVLGTGVKATVNEEEKTITVGNDETVLWEGKQYADNTIINLSESIQNFEYVEFWAGESTFPGGTGVMSKKVPTDLANNTKIYVSTASDWDNPWFVIFTLPLTLNDDKVTVHKSSWIGYTPSLSTNFQNTQGCLVRVVGINRKQQV